jgi:D-alanyl-D-alanine carboxypeptidase
MLLIDADTGKVLHSENSTQPWYPASVTKLMTAYVTLRAVKERRITLDTLLTVSPNAVAQAPSKMGFKAGTTVTVDNALKMLMVKSANDVAVVLAEGVSGSIEKFADDMNKNALRIGMTQTSYVNPNGLPADGQLTSARDMAMLARAIIRDLPEYEYFTHIPAIRFGRRITRNFNSLIGRYPGADGMKTGFICDSGFNIVASATRDGQRLFAVVLGEVTGSERSTRAANLLEHGFQTHAWKAMFGTYTLETLPADAEAKGAASIRQSVISWACGTGRRRSVARGKRKRAGFVAARPAAAAEKAAPDKAVAPSQPVNPVTEIAKSKAPSQEKAGDPRP